MSRQLNRQEILQALGMLDEELAEMGVQADLFIVGGAAMAIAYDARRATTDVDAIFVPTKEVRHAADRVASELNLAKNWLNDGAKGFLPGADSKQVDVYEGKNLRVATASPEYLLAMKLMSFRPERDFDDIEVLYNILGFTTADEGLDLLASYYPQSQILPRVQFLLAEKYPSKQEHSRDVGPDR